MTKNHLEQLNSTNHVSTNERNSILDEVIEAVKLGHAPQQLVEDYRENLQISLLKRGNMLVEEFLLPLLKSMVDLLAVNQLIKEGMEFTLESLSGLFKAIKPEEQNVFVLLKQISDQEGGESVLDIAQAKFLEVLTPNLPGLPELIPDLNSFKNLLSQITNLNDTAR